MKFITRLNPTANGPLHLGHAYMGLVNQHEARASGGKFFVRMDDNQRYWLWKLGEEKVFEYSELVRRDLDWLGIVPDEYQSQLARADGQKLIEDHLGEDERGIGVGQWFYHSAVPETPASDALQYPYAAWLTAEKVALDFIDGVNLLIRGDDLLTEFSLYSYFCDLWGLPSPRQVYLPRLRLSGGFEMQTHISKTLGNYKICDLRSEGYGAKQVLRLLKVACLIKPELDWSIDNVRKEPRYLHEKCE